MVDRGGRRITLSTIHDLPSTPFRLPWRFPWRPWRRRPPLANKNYPEARGISDDTNVLSDDADAAPREARNPRLG
jgi:hypothetical protein